MLIFEKMRVILNGEERSFPELSLDARLSDLVAALGLKADRVAIEHNGAIAARPGWNTAELREGDKLEIVHFVGGGSPGDESGGRFEC